MIASLLGLFCGVALIEAEFSCYLEASTVIPDLIRDPVPLVDAGSSPA
jgi:hypothetical protein